MHVVLPGVDWGCDTPPSPTGNEKEKERERERERNRCNNDHVNTSLAAACSAGHSHDVHIYLPLHPAQVLACVCLNDWLTEQVSACMSAWAGPANFLELCMSARWPAVTSWEVVMNSCDCEQHFHTLTRLDILLSLYTSLFRPHLEYCIPAWSPHCVKDKELIERIQHRFTKMFPELRKLPYLQRLESETVDSWRTKSSCRFNRVYKANLKHHFFSERIIIIGTILTIKQWRLDQSTSSKGIWKDSDSQMR